MYIYFTSRKVDRTFLVCGIVAFAFAFPVGAGVAVAAFWGQGQSEWVDLLRVALANSSQGYSCHGGKINSRVLQYASY